MRFASVGAISAGLSLCLNFIFLKFLQTPLYPTYIIIYLLTIFNSFYFNSKITFGTALNIKNLIKYYIVYGTSLLLGVALLALFQWIITLETWIYPFLVAPFTVLWNFNWASVVLKKAMHT